MNKAVILFEVVVVLKVLDVPLYLIESSSVEGTMEKDWSSCSAGIISLKVHKREKFFGSDFEFFTIL
jgi:hypothetical protein